MRSTKQNIYEYTHMPHKTISLDSPIEQKIVWAQDCFQDIGDLLLGDTAVGSALDRLKQAIGESHEEMAASGIIDICGDCDRNEGGSCCGKGLENHYSGILLLINLMLDVKLPKTRHDPSGCFFLDQAGCRLQARHVICINYVCHRITNRIDPRVLSGLREKEGRELECLFILNEQIITILSKNRMLL